MDIAMPQLNGIEATRRIKELAPDSKIIVLSAHGDDAFRDQMLSIGASAYLIKETSSETLASTVRDVFHGRRPESGAGDPAKPAAIDRLGNVKPAGRPLTSRETEVLQMIAEGLANKQIAAELSISIKTVEKHRQNIMNKLEIHETAGLTRYAVSMGIIEADPGWRAT
jgi:DNA-binding NarL/FixJ family response regulator